MSHAQMDAMFAESGIAPDEVAELARLLAPLDDLTESVPVPVPSAELLGLFGEETPAAGSDEPSQLRSLRSARRGRSAVAGVVVLALSGVGATGLSAAANTLPSPWQHQVSDFSRHYLPFDFPEPATRSDPTGHPAGAGRSTRPDPDGGTGPASGALREDSDEASRSLTDSRGGPSWSGRSPMHEDTRAFVTLHGSGGPADSPGSAPATAPHAYTSAPATESAGQGDAGHENHGQTKSEDADRGKGPDKGGNKGEVTRPAPKPDKPDKPPSMNSGGSKGAPVVLGQDPLGGGKGQLGKPGAGSGDGGSGKDQPGEDGDPGEGAGGSPGDQGGTGGTGATGHDDGGTADDVGPLPG